ncbi:unnamed protein product [Fasciola hepatica]|uniref:SCP domain-containing protein n=1 Tax=Fasciola hepatica TaxID=6192 RepID=A0ABC9HGL7_FASHE
MLRKRMFFRLSEEAGNLKADHSYESSFNSWFVEHMNYTFDTMECDPGVQCGHYTQIVSARTTHIGCGSAMCKKSVRFPWRVTVTCNYGPNGNTPDFSFHDNQQVPEILSPCLADFI